VINNLEITADYDYDYGLHGLSYSKLYVKVKNKDTGNVLEMVDVGELKPIDNFFPLGHDLVFNDVDGALLNDETLNYEKRKNVEQKFDEALRKILPGLEKKLLECEKNMNKTIDEDFRL
ncbi:MAG: hypothetical protein KKA79_08990, partial [Nanoarchaeota archaeon]|nr:hypothetical protein [Nanoarchaeota archaeon]